MKKWRACGAPAFLAFPGTQADENFKQLEDVLLMPESLVNEKVAEDTGLRVWRRNRNIVDGYCLAVSGDSPNKSESCAGRVDARCR